MTQWNPNDYNQHSAQQQKWAKEILPRLALKGDERILDIGCGDGKITAEVAQHVPNGSVVGVDASAEMIDFAKKQYSTVANLHFEERDARSLNFDGQFDWVISFACLHWVIDHRPMLAGIRRSLCPDGRILLQCGGKGNAAEIAQVVFKIIAEPKWANYFTDFTFPWGFYSPDEYRPWLEEVGFTVTHLILIPKDMTHAGREGLKGWLRTTWMPYWQRVPSDLQQQFIDEIVDEYLQGHPLDSNGLVHLPMVRLEIEAKRERRESHDERRR
jgi:trans-aconitate 2-methyltransferase